MAPARATVAAEAACDVTFARDPVTHGEAAHFAAHVDDTPVVLVPDGHRHRNRLLRPGIPIVDVHVGAADRGLHDLDEDVVRADGWHRDVLHPDAGAGFTLDQCLHINSSSRPTSTNASSARSSCASVKPADI